MTQTLTNPKFDRVTWLSEILAILDESQGIRERLQDMNQRLHGVSPIVSCGPAINNLLLVEKILGNAVDNDLAETLKKISTEKSEKVVDN